MAAAAAAIDPVATVSARSLARGTVLGAALLAAMASAHGRPKKIEFRQTEDSDFSGDLTLAYDGYEHRTSQWKATGAVLWDDGSPLTAGAYFTATTGAGLPFTWRDNAYGGVWISRSLLSDDEESPFTLELTGELSGPSLLASRGIDFDLSLDFRWEISDDWRGGASVGGTLASAPDAGNRAGYPYGTVWLGRSTGWLPHGSDALAVGAYIAGNEDPELGTLLAVELNYAFNVGEHSRLTLILGSEVVSPYDHDPLYVGFSWSWSL